MDSPAAAPEPSSSSASRRWVPSALVLAFLAYALVLALHMGAYAGGSDSSGYMNNARLIARHRLHVEQRAIRGIPPDTLPSYTYVPLGFIPIGHAEMVPTYPVGLSLFFLAFSPLVGWTLAPGLAIWLHALAGVLLTFALARAMGFSREGAALGALLLAISPVYLFISVQALSDVPALTWCTAAMLGAWLSRRHRLWALAAGGALAVAVIMRPSNLLIALPVGLCLGLDWRRWFWLGLGGLPGAIFLALLNHALYGSPFTTGYGAVEQIFKWEYAPLSLRNYALYLPELLTPAVVLVFALPWLARRGSRLLVATLAVWLLSFAGFYAFYFHTHETWWYLRFLLPAFPAAIIAILLAGRALARRWSPRAVRLGLAVSAGLAFVWSGFWTLQKHALSIGDSEYRYVQVAHWAQSRLPANAIIATMQTSGALFYYTPLTLIRYDQFHPDDFAKIVRAAAAGARPIYAALFPFEVKHALEQQMPGQWTQVGAVRDTTFWRLDGPTPTPVNPTPAHEFFSEKLGRLEVSGQMGAGWYEAEHNSIHAWSWSSGHGKLDLDTWPKTSHRVRLDFALRAFSPCTVTISQGNAILWQGVVGTSRLPVSLTLAIHEGHTQLEFATDAPPRLEGGQPDARKVTFALYDPKLTAADEVK
jgi:hypothetical protein